MVELKWKNTTTVDVSIPPRKFRYLDGVHVNSSNPNTVWLGINYNVANWEKLHTNFQIRLAGDYEIEYVGLRCKGEGKKILQNKDITWTENKLTIG